MENKNNKMTLEKLAEMTQKGFEELRSEFKSDLKNEIGGLRGEMDERFKQVDRRFEQVDRRFKQVDEKFDRVDARFNRVLDNQDHILKRLDDLETDGKMDVAVSFQIV